MKKVLAYIHTHWDREWYREYEEFRIRLVEVVDDVLEKLNKEDIPSFYFDGQTCALEDYLEIKPQNTDLIKKLIKEKKLFIGPYYCSTDSFLVDAESLIKNLQLGIKDSKILGCFDFIAYHADTFGHSRFIPEIIKYFNINNAVFWRGLGELKSEFNFRNLKATYLIEGYFHDYFNTNLPFEKKAELLKRTLDRIANYSSDIILLPIGADHMKCPDNLKKQLKEIKKHLPEYEIELCSPFDYMKAVDNNPRTNFDCEFRDTKRNFILPGVSSSRLDLKQKNAESQWRLSRILQPLAAVLNYIDKTKNLQLEIDYIYKLLIKNQPHDSIYGCSIDNVHKENKIRFLKVSEGSNALLNTLKRDIFEENHLSVINLSNFDFTGALKLITDKKLNKKYNAQLIKKCKGFPLKKVYDTNQVPITEDYTTLYEYLVDIKKTSAFSTKQIGEKDINLTSALKITNNTIENANIKLSVINGSIELEDKTRQKKYKNFLKFIDRADVGDSYNFGALENDTPVDSKIQKTKIIEKGHIKSILEIDFEIFIPESSSDKGRSSKIKKTLLKLFVMLENQNNYIEFKTEWENKSYNHILQAEFEMEKPVTKTCSDDICGYTKRYFETKYDIYKHIPAQRGIELKHNTAPMQKCVLAQGVGLITKGLPEYEIYNNKLRLTILRATGTISNPKNPTRGTPAGPPLPTPDLQMIGHNEAEFAVCFKDDIKELESEIEKFYGAAMLFSASLENKKLFSLRNDNILVSTVKTNTDNDLLVRFVNKTEQEQELNFNTELKNCGLYITNAMEEIITEYKNQKIMPNSFLTVLIKK